MYFKQKRRNPNLPEPITTSTNVSGISIREPNEDLNNSQVASTAAHPILKKGKEKESVTVKLNDMCYYFSSVNQFISKACIVFLHLSFGLLQALLRIKNKKSQSKGTNGQTSKSRTDSEEMPLTQGSTILDNSHE